MRSFTLLSCTIMLLCSSLAAEVPKTTAKTADTTDPRKVALLKRILTAADKNKDGRLSVTEFKTLDVQALHHGPEHFEQGDTEIITRMAQAMAEWFPGHAASMDAGLAQHLQSVGFDTRTETLADPSRVRPASMSGCGSVTCS